MNRQMLIISALILAAVGGVGSATFMAARARSARLEAETVRADLATLQQGRDAQEKQTADLREELARTTAALEKADSDLQAAKRANIDLGSKLTGYSEELVRKQSELRQVSDTQAQLVDQLKRELDNRSITITRLGNSLSVNMVGHVLFASGQASLTPEGVKVLQHVGQVISQTGDKHIRVVGHTDDVPISPGRKGLYASNWELSANRATCVVRFLTGQVGIPPERCEAVGMAEFHPVVPNDSAEGRSRNRRIEILLVPPPAKAAAEDVPSGTTVPPTAPAADQL